MSNKNALDVSYSTEGPTYDPYSVTTIYFIDLFGNQIVMMMGLWDRLFLNGTNVCEELSEGNDPFVEFEALTGISVEVAMRVWEKYYHSDFVDPMGCAADYE